MAEAPTRPGPGPRRPSPDLPEHVTEPLLELITQRSLDADYEHAAARRRAAGAAPPDHAVPRRTAGMVLLVFGLLVTVAAVQTSRNASASHASRDSLVQQVNLRRDSLSALQKQVSRADGQVLDLKAQLSSLAAAQRTTQSRVQRLQARTGF